MMNPDNPTDSGGAWRDVYMAENIEYLLNQEKQGTKMVVWAHNGHISMASWGQNIPAMGLHLRKVYGDSYYALGFAFNEGAFQSRNMDRKNGSMDLVEFTVGTAPEASVGWFLSQPGIDRFIVDFHSAPKNGKVSEWLSRPHLMRFIGAGYSKKNEDHYLASVILKDHFDGIFYINKTTRARPNPTGMRPRPKKEVKKKNNKEDQ